MHGARGRAGTAGRGVIPCTVATWLTPALVVAVYTALRVDISGVHTRIAVITGRVDAPSVPREPNPAAGGG